MLWCGAESSAPAARAEIMLFDALRRLDPFIPYSTGTGGTGYAGLALAHRRRQDAPACGRPRRAGSFGAAAPSHHRGARDADVTLGNVC